MFVVVAAVLLGAAPCDALIRATDLARSSGDPGAIAAAAALLPGPSSVRVRDEVGRGGVEVALALLARSTTIECPTTAMTTATPAPDPAALRQIVASDGRFLGVRADDVSERLLERLQAFIEGILESEGMQRFSEHTRTVYLALLAFVCSFVALRVVRRSRLVAAAGPSTGVVVGVDRVRTAAFSALRNDAMACLDASPRQAVLLLRRALLARVGEVDEGATRPSRTTSEILARLDDRHADAVAPAFHRFDGAFYSGGVDTAGARAVLEAVDVAVAALQALRGAR